jgi:hypothetical protein
VAYQLIEVTRMGISGGRTTPEELGEHGIYAARKALEATNRATSALQDASPIPD